MGNIYQGDVGVKFRIDTGIDLSGSTVQKLYVLTPTGQVEWAPVVVTTGDPMYNETQGLSIIEYITKPNDLLQKGQYYIISYVEFGSDSKHHGEPASFMVFAKFHPK